MKTIHLSRMTLMDLFGQIQLMHAKEEPLPTGVTIYEDGDKQGYSFHRYDV